MLTVVVFTYISTVKKALCLGYSILTIALEKLQRYFPLGPEQAAACVF